MKSINGIPIGTLLVFHVLCGIVINPKQTFEYNSILLTGNEFNCTVRDFLCPRHWLFIDFNVIQNCTQNYRMWVRYGIHIDSFSKPFGKCSISQCLSCYNLFYCFVDKISLLKMFLHFKFALYFTHIVLPHPRDVHSYDSKRTHNQINSFHFQCKPHHPSKWYQCPVPMNDLDLDTAYHHIGIPVASMPPK